MLLPVSSRFKPLPKFPSRVVQIRSAPRPSINFKSTWGEHPTTLKTNPARNSNSFPHKQQNRNNYLSRANRTREIPQRLPSIPAPVEFITRAPPLLPITMAKEKPNSKKEKEDRAKARVVARQRSVRVTVPDGSLRTRVVGPVPRLRSGGVRKVYLR